MARRTDANQRSLINAFRELGFAVFTLSDVGRGFPDLIVSRAGINYLFEVKDGTKPPSQRALTPAEQLFFDSWKGHAAVITSVQEVIDFANSIV